MNEAVQHMRCQLFSGTLCPGQQGVCRSWKHGIETAAQELLRDRHPQMHLELRVTRNADWEGARGRLKGQHILEHVEDVNSAEIFLCGPPAMTDELVKQLEPISLKLHYERWW